MNSYVLLMFTLLGFSFLVVMFWFGVLTFVSMREHLLSTLLSLEYLVLILYGLFVMNMYLFNYHIYFSMGFLTFSVCEGALGLSILVSMIRTHGNDYFQSFSILQC